MCRFIKDPLLFGDCFSEVDAEVYFKMCVYDVCSKADPTDHTPMCTVVAALARECAAQGLLIDWREMGDLPLLCRKYIRNVTLHPFCIYRVRSTSVSDKFVVSL